MDPAQMANEAVRRLQATCDADSSTVTRESSDAIIDLFEQLAVLDGWAKIARDRVLADPADTRAALELSHSCEQTARLHPQFIRRLADLVADRAAVKTAMSGAVPAQPTKGLPLPG